MRRIAVGLLFAALTTGAEAQEAFWGSPSVDGGRCCQTLGEVRDHIDALDAQIVKLMAERQKYVGEASRFKKDPAAVSAPARVEAVIAKVKTLAADAGLAPDVAERAYRAMIAAFEDYERAQWLAEHPKP